MRKRKRSQAERRLISAPWALSACYQSTPDLAAFLQQADIVQQVPPWCTLEKLTCCAPLAQSLISHFSIIFTTLAFTRNFMGNYLNGSPNLGYFRSALVHIFFPCMIKQQQRTHSVICNCFDNPSSCLFLSPPPSLYLLIPCWCGLAAAARLPDVLLCWTGPRGLLEKELCAASADRLTQPLPASDPLLTDSPVCQGRKKCKQKGSVHPGAEHRTLFILSPLLLPESPIPASG